MTRQTQGHDHQETVQLLTPREAARVLCISPRSLWTYTKRGAVPHVRIGRLTRYSLADLRRWIERNTQGGES